MRHLVIGQRQKAPNFSTFHWSPHGCPITIGQNFVTTRVVHLPKRTETSLITESDQTGPNHQLLQLCTVDTAWPYSDRAVRAVHSCISWFRFFSLLDKYFRLFIRLRMINRREQQVSDPGPSQLEREGNNTECLQILINILHSQFLLVLRQTLEVTMKLFILQNQSLKKGY